MFAAVTWPDVGMVFVQQVLVPLLAIAGSAAVYWFKLRTLSNKTDTVQVALDDNTSKTVAAAAASATAAKQTEQIQRIVNGERSKLIERVAELERQLGAERAKRP